MKNCHKVVVWSLIIYAVLQIAAAFVIMKFNPSWEQLFALLFIDVLLAVFGYYIITLQEHKDEE